MLPRQLQFLSTSVIALKLPLSQLLSKIPPKIEPNPIHQNGIAPATNCPIKILFDMITKELHQQELNSTLMKQFQKEWMLRQ